MTCAMSESLKRAAKQARMAADLVRKDAERVNPAAVTGMRWMMGGWTVRNRHGSDCGTSWPITNCMRSSDTALLFRPFSTWNDLAKRGFHHSESAICMELASFIVTKTLYKLWQYVVRFVSWSAVIVALYLSNIPIYQNIVIVNSSSVQHLLCTTVSTNSIQCLVNHAHESRVSIAITRVSVCVILSVCPHDKTKTSETKITELGTGIIHHHVRTVRHHASYKGQRSR